MIYCTSHPSQHFKREGEVILKPQEISLGSFVIIISKLIGLLIGMSVTVVLAYQFGKGLHTDALFAAQLIPVNYMNRILHAIFSSFIPQFKETFIRENETAAWDVASSVINLFLLFFFLISLFLYFFAPVMVNITSPGFDGERFALTIDLLKIFTPFLFLTACCHVLGTMAYSYKQFLIPAVGANFSKVGALIGLFFLTRQFGIKGIVWGMIGGALLNLIIHLFFLKDFSTFYKFKIDFKRKEVRNVLKQFSLLLVATSLTQINLTIDQIFASFLGTGKISALNYANRILNIIASLFPGAVVMATFPTLSEKMAQNKLEELKRIVRKNITLISFILIPLVFLVILSANELTGFLFKRGNFTSDDTAMVVKAVIYYVPGVFFGAIASIITPVFYIAYQTKEVLKIGGISCLLNAVLDYFLIRNFDYAGIAVSTSVCALFNVCALGVLLNKKIFKLEWRKMADSFKRIILTSMAMLIFLLGIDRFHFGYLDGINKVLFILITGNLIYLILNYITETEELSLIYGNLKSIASGIRTRIE